MTLVQFGYDNIQMHRAGIVECEGQSGGVTIPGQNFESSGLRKAAACENRHDQDRIDTFFHDPVGNFHS